MNSIQLTHRKHIKLVKDYYQTAAVAKLIYVTDKEKGINRIKKGHGFTYLLNNVSLKNKVEITRIRKLAIPPAWTNV